MAHPIEPAHYSLYWARCRVKELRESYPRASKFVGEMLRITPESLAKALANGDEIFAQLRNMIHRTERIMSQLGENSTDVRVLEQLRYFYSDNRYPRCSEALDRARIRPDIKRAGSIGAGPQPEWDEGQLPLFPELEPADGIGQEV